MKKLIYCALALAAGLFATSCQQENLEPVQGGNTVTFTVEIPEVVTKASVVDDGTNINNLVYAVYRTDESNLADAAASIDQTKLVYRINPKAQGGETAFTADGKTNVTLELINNQKYIVLFWAQVNETWVTGTDFDLTNIAYPNELTANQNKYEAFCGAAFVDEVKGATKKSVTLTRPFAQINLASTDPANYNVDIVESGVKIENVYPKFNVATKKASGEFRTVEYAISENPDGEFGDYDHYVAMNYIFANPQNDGTTPVKVTCTINTASHGKNIVKEVSNVPVAQNYRTNIVGNLLTSDVEYTVELDKEWGGAALAPDALHLAAAFGGEVTLTTDVVLESTLLVQANMTINLNGKTISANMHKNEGAVIKNNATLTLIGGTVSSLGENGGSAVQNSGIMIIEDVTLNGAPNANGSWPSYTVNNTGELTIIDSKITSHHGAVASYGEGAIVNLNNSNIDMAGIPGFTSHGIYTYSNGKVVVNGGTYENKATDQAASGASVINGAVEVNAGDFSGRIENYYGTPVLKGGSYTVKPNANFIAAGYEVLIQDGKYHVVAEGTDASVSSSAELASLVNNATEDITVSLAKDLEGKISLTQKAEIDVTILGNGHKYTGAIHIWGNGAGDDRSMTIKNIAFDGTGLTGDEGCIYTTGAVDGKNSYACNVTIEDCTFTGAGVAAIRQNVAGEKDWIIRNCTVASNMHSLLQVSNTNKGDSEYGLLVEGCKVYSESGANLTSTQFATFKNCVFDVKGYAVRVGPSSGTGNGVREYYTFEDCTFKSDYFENKAVVIVRSTAQNATLNFVRTTLEGDVLFSGITEHTTVTIDGKAYASTAAQLTAAVNNGYTDIVLAGEFEMPSNGTTNAIQFSSLNGTAVIDNTKGSYWDGATLTFNNVNFKTGTGMANGNGADYAALYSKNVTYNECNFNGPMRLGRDGAKFNACTFNGLGNDYVWTYGTSASFEGCTFNTDGKAILIYSDGATGTNGAAPAVSVTNCTFNATQGAKAGAIANQNCAAVEIHNYGNGVTLTTSGNTVDDEFSGVWRIKTYENRFSESKIFVNGTEYTTIALDGKTMTIDADKNVTVL